MADFELQFGSIVPSGAINLAWVSPPPLNPEENILLMDVVRSIPWNKPNYYTDPITASLTNLSINYEGNALTLPISVSTLQQQLTHIHSPISLIQPVEDATNAWNLQVVDGTFTTLSTFASATEVYTDRDGNTQKSWLLKAAEEGAWNDGDRLVLIYSIPEVLTAPYLTGTTRDERQEYNLRAVEVIDEPVEIADDHTILLNNKNIYLISSIKINEETIVSTDIYKGDSNSEIISIDFENGVIQLTRSITPRENVEVSYRYSQRAYLYKGYYNEDVGMYHDLDLNPSYGHTFDNGQPGWKLLSEVVYIYLLPSAAYSYEEYLTGTINIHSALKWTQHLIRWESGPCLTLGSTGINGYTPPGGTDIVLSSSTYGHCWYNVSRFASKLPFDSPQVILIDGSVGEGLTAGGYGTLSGNPNAAILAKIYVTPNGIIDSVKLLDTRRYGGGVQEDYELAEHLVTGDQLSEIAACWDTAGWEGDPAMLNGVVVIDIPEDILSGTNGYTQFTEREVEEIVNKHIAAGIKPIIRYVRV